MVPEAYDFLGKTNQYQLNALTKFLFEKNGFETVMKNESKPADLNSNPCLGLTPNITEDSGLFKTKIVLQLKDCYGNVVYATREGTSKNKDYKEAYQESLRDAFGDIASLNYKYQPEPIAENDVAEEEEETTVVEVEAEVEDEQEVIAEKEMKREADDAQNIKIEEIEEDEQDVIVANSESVNKIYQKDNAAFILKSTEQGFGLYPENSSEPIALLIETDNSDYIYSSLSNQGIASFDAENNLVVEYFSRTENKKIKQIYQLQN